MALRRRRARGRSPRARRESSGAVVSGFHVEPRGPAIPRSIDPCKGGPPPRRGALSGGGPRSLGQSRSLRENTLRRGRGGLRGAGPGGQVQRGAAPGRLAAGEELAWGPSANSHMPDRGFILTPTTRVVAGCPEIHLHAVMEDGAPALVIEDRFRPYFFVRARDEDIARRLAGTAASPRRRSDARRRAGPARRRGAPPGRRGAARRAGEAGADALRADVRFSYRFLIDRGIHEGVRGLRAFRAPPGRRARVPQSHARARDLRPRLRVLSLDIETKPRRRALYAVGLAGAGGERCLLVRDEPVPGGLPPSSSAS